MAAVIGALAAAFLLLAIGFTCGADIYYRVVDYRERRQAAKGSVA